jgi:hypothetical protein
MPDVRAIVIAVLLAGPGCLSFDAAAPSPSVSTGVAWVEPASPCDVDACGNGNSPIIAGVWFWKLNWLGLPNDPADPGSVRVTGVVSKDKVKMVLLADGDRLVGYNKVAWDAGIKVKQAEGKDLGDTQIHVKLRGKNYSIRIEYLADADGGVRTVPFWLPMPEWSKPVELYRFFYRPLDPPEDKTGETQLCQRPAGEPPGPGEQWLDAIVFTGDLYNPETKDITTAGTDGWMNIACHMGAPYKMHLMGHTTVAGKKLGLRTSIDERKSLLNAFTMNACGTGKAFTVQGTEINLKSRWNLDAPRYLPEVKTHEAIWGPDGALCLGRHRLATNKDSDAVERAEIAAECPKRSFESCDAMWDFWGDATHHGLFRTSAPNWPKIPVIAPP